MRSATRLLVILSCALATLALAFRPPPAVEQTRTLSNIKQIALGAIMYTADNDDQLPWVQNTETIKAVTYPYIKSLEAWKTANPAKSVFLFNMALGGVIMATVKDPVDKVPLYYESKPWADGRRTVAYLDGHARIVNATMWATDSKMLKKKWKRTARRPLPKNHLHEYIRGR